MESESRPRRQHYQRPPELDLELVEQVVLLSLEGHRGHVVRAADIAARTHRGKCDSYRSAVASLETRGLTRREGVMRHLRPEPGPTRMRYVRLVQRTIASPAVAEGSASELLALLAAAGTLPVSSAPDHLKARHRLADLDHRQPLAPAVIALMEDVNVESTSELADKLLPPRLFPLAEHASGQPIGHVYGYSAFL